MHVCISIYKEYNIQYNLYNITYITFNIYIIIYLYITILCMKAHTVVLYDTYDQSEDIAHS